MFLADTAATVQPWVWVFVAFAVALVIWGILADMGERSRTDGIDDGRAAGSGQAHDPRSMRG